MKEFICRYCRRYKKPELLGKVFPNKTKACQGCLDKVEEAEKVIEQRRIAELNRIG